LQPDIEIVNLFEIALISLALAFNTSGICMPVGYSLRKSDAGLLLRFLFLLVTSQLIFSFIGLLLGKAISGMFSFQIEWIVLSFLLIMGIKILSESLQAKSEDLAFNNAGFRSVIKLSLMASVNPFIVFTGIGFIAPILPNTIVVIGATFLLFCSAWLIIGRVRGSSSLRFRLGQVGGLILLAAGLHIFLKLIR
jgi:putative Mn2+ efflux pump MntP